jgi:flavin reductase (DIM6/NTAB) family NADH-FMN oxidoreductase RutF
MKHELGIARPAQVQEVWPGQYEIFSWIEYAVSIPYPTYLITTGKENGKGNACWHSWGCFSGEGRAYHSVLVLSEAGHTLANVLRTREWCINLPTLAQQEMCGKTIELNSGDNDEIVDAGFTAEPSVVVDSPRIAECPINLECTLEWHRPLAEGSGQRIVVGQVVHVAMDECACVADPHRRLKNLNTMFNLRSTLDPLTGESRPGRLAVLDLP